MWERFCPTKRFWSTKRWSPRVERLCHQGENGDEVVDWEKDRERFRVGFGCADDRRRGLLRQHDQAHRLRRVGPTHERNTEGTRRITVRNEGCGNGAARLCHHR